MVQIGRLLSEAAVCTSIVGEQNMFTISDDDIEKLDDVEMGDTLQVIIVKSNKGDEDDEGTLSLRDRLNKVANSNRFSAQLFTNNQVLIPNDVANTLDLEQGDRITYLVIPNSEDLPSLTGGFLRNKIKGDDSNATSNSAADKSGVDRPERTSDKATYGGMTMASTGQTRIPGEVMEELGLIQGDPIDAKVEWEGQKSEWFRSKVDTQRRVTIRNAIMDEFGLQQGDEPTITVRVVPDS